MSLKDFVGKLDRAERFVDAARIVCDETKALDIDQCAVLLHGASGPPVLAVDNFLEITDEHRLYGVSQHNWDHNPIFIVMRERVGPLGVETLDPLTFIPLARAHGYTGPTHYPFVVPVIGPSGWFATIMCGSARPPLVAVERDIAMIATHLSVWCTGHNMSDMLDPPPNERLGPRQQDIAQLAARGFMNAEIAHELGISINTVKSRLKQVFERLSVDNRTELANVLRPLAPADDVPDGVTHFETVTITRTAGSCRARVPRSGLRASGR
jgi:DNA-binding CsgD family transcriptional regulator